MSKSPKKPKKAKPSKAKPSKAKPTKAKAAKKPAKAKPTKAPTKATKPKKAKASQPAKAKPSKPKKAPGNRRASTGDTSSSAAPKRPPMPTTQAGASAELRARRALLKDELARVRVEAKAAKEARAHAMRDARSICAAARATAKVDCSRSRERARSACDVAIREARARHDSEVDAVRATMERVAAEYRGTKPPKRAGGAKRKRTWSTEAEKRREAVAQTIKHEIPTEAAPLAREFFARHATGAYRPGPNFSPLEAWQQWVHDHPAWVQERAKAYAAREERALRAREKAILRDLREFERLMGRPLTDEDVRRELSREHVSYAGALLDPDGDGELAPLTPAVRAVQKARAQASKKTGRPVAPRSSGRVAAVPF